MIKFPTCCSGNCCWVIPNLKLNCLTIIPIWPKIEDITDRGDYDSDCSTRPALFRNIALNVCLKLVIIDIKNSPFSLYHVTVIHVSDVLMLLFISCLEILKGYPLSTMFVMYCIICNIVVLCNKSQFKALFENHRRGRVNGKLLRLGFGLAYSRTYLKVHLNDDGWKGHFCIGQLAWRSTGREKKRCFKFFETKKIFNLFFAGHTFYKERGKLHKKSVGFWMFLFKF